MCPLPRRYRIGIKSRRRGWPSPGCRNQRVYVRGVGAGILRYCGVAQHEDAKKAAAARAASAKKAAAAKAASAKAEAAAAKKAARASDSSTRQPSGAKKTVAENQPLLSDTASPVPASDPTPATALPSDGDQHAPRTDVGTAEAEAAAAEHASVMEALEAELDEAVICGVVLDSPVPDGAPDQGVGDGEFKGHRYFTCQKGHSIFLPLSSRAVELAEETGTGVGDEKPSDVSALEFPCFAVTCVTTGMIPVFLRPLGLSCLSPCLGSRFHAAPASRQCPISPRLILLRLIHPCLSHSCRCVPFTFFASCYARRSARIPPTPGSVMRRDVVTTQELAARATPPPAAPATPSKRRLVKRPCCLQQAARPHLPPRMQKTRQRWT